MLRTLAARIDDIEARRDPLLFAERALRRALRDAPFVRGVISVSAAAGAGGALVDVVRLECHHRFILGPYRPAIAVGERVVCRACRRTGRRRPISNTLGGA